MGKYKKQIIIGIIVAIMIMVSIPTLLRPQPAGALFGFGDITFSTTVGDIPGMIWRAIDKALTTTARVTFKNTLSNFVNTFAYNQALKIAAGGKGQKPLFFDMAKVIESAADQAVGEFATELLTASSGGGKCQITGQSCTHSGQSQNFLDKRDLGCPMIAQTDPDKAEEFRSTPGLISPYKFADNKFNYLIIESDAEWQAAITDPAWAVEGTIRRDKCQMADNAKFVGIDICSIGSPAAEIVIKNIALNYQEAPRPRCTFNKLKQTFEDLRNINTGGLIRVSEQFNSRSSQLGIIQNITSRSIENRSAFIETEKLLAGAAGGVKQVENLVTKETKTPAPFIQESITEALVKAPWDTVTTFTDDIIADAISTFTNTLVAKTAQKIFDRGLGSDSSGSGSGGSRGLSSLSNFGGSLTGVAAARLKFADLQKLTDLKLRERDPSALLQQMTTGCSISSTQSTGVGTVRIDALRETNNCIIDESFSLAIQQGLTVGQAINYRNDARQQQLINPNKDFGYHADGGGSGALAGDGCDGCDKTIISLRSILVLQKYNIVPVGWELAARYIGEVMQPAGKVQSFNLRELVENYGNPESPFYRLVDPDWQLKAPPSVKEIRGPGERIIASYPVPKGDTNEDGRLDELDEISQVVQRGQEASDEQTCIYENEDGTCAYWGYCTEQKPVWRIIGSSCDEEFNTCQSFTNTENNTQANYLTKTADGSICSADNAGCRRYAVNTDAVTGAWLINDLPADNILADRGAIECDSDAAGCSQYLRLTDLRGNSLPAFNADADPLNSVDEIVSRVLADSGDIDSYSEHALAQSLYIGGEAIDCHSDFDFDGDGVIDVDGNVACQLFSPASYSGPDIPGVITPATIDSDGVITAYNDECPAECVGYQPYEESARPTLYPNAGYFNFIADTARQCSVQDIGCTEFTNLNEVAQGGEGIEYYSQLRQCVTEGEPGLTTYFTWEGSDETGFQLVSWRLMPGGPGGGPIHAGAGDYNLCTAGIYGLAPEDPRANPDCREFIDASLNRYYRLASRVIIGTNECQPLRRTLTDVNYDGAINDLDCAAPGTVEANGCVYFGLPSDSIACNATVLGCRQYQGFGSGNVEVLLNSVFESGTLDGWTEPGGGTGNLDVVNYSVLLGGHSMNIQTATQLEKIIDGVERQNYILTFWAAGDSILTARLEDENGNTYPFAGSAVLTPGWQQYMLGPAEVNTFPFGEVNLVIDGWSATGNFIDNIILTESNDLFLVSGSWQTPEACENPSQLYCEEYRDSSRQQKFIKNFTRLCRDEYVGCEAFVDTQNSDTALGFTFDGGNADAIDDVVVAADAVAYIVNDEDKYCKQADAGCTELGLRTVNRAGEISTSERYRVIDPDQFVSSLCVLEEELCQEYAPTGGFPVYFKDPQGRVCIYRTNVVIPPDNDVKSGWFKQGANPVTAEDVCQDGNRPNNETSAPVCNFNYNRQFFEDPLSILPDFNWGYYNDLSATPPLTGCYTYECDSNNSTCSQFQDPISPAGCDVELLPGEGRCNGTGSTCYARLDCNAGNPIGPIPCLLPSHGAHCGGDPSGVSCLIDEECAVGESCIEINDCDYYYFLKNSLDQGVAECQGQIDPGLGCVGFYETDRGLDSRYLRADCQANCALILSCYDLNLNTYGGICVSDLDCGINQECRGLPVQEFPSCAGDPNLTNPNSKPGCVL